MIRLRKHDRKMLKVAAVLASCVLIILGLIFVDVLRGFPQAAPGGHGNNNHRDLQRDLDRVTVVVNADYIQTQAPELTYADGVSAAPTALGSDASDATFSNAFEAPQDQGGGSTGSSIPEPSTLGLGVLGGLLLVNRKRLVRRMAA